MTFPRTLSWMGLFPEDANYVCEKGPAWLQEAIASHNPRGSKQVLVAWESRPEELPNLEPFSGLVVVNGRGLSEKKFRREGFARVRRFAAVPNWSNLRWLIPLDRPAASSAAFSLHTPIRLSARVKSWGARWAARTGAAKWHRDQVWIAQREPSPLEYALEEVFADGRRTDIHVRRFHDDGQEFPSYDDGDGHECPSYSAPYDRLEFALSTSNARSERNCKLLMAALDRRGRVLGFAKRSLSPASAPRVRHEAQVLQALAGSRRSIAAPQLLFDGCVDGSYLTVASPLSGRIPGTKLTDAHRRFLATLASGERKPVAQTALFRTLRVRAARVAAEYDFTGWLDRAAPLFERLVLPTTIVHRDFAPWNLRRRRGEIAAFDWESAELEGPPLLDEVHHELVVAYFLERCSADRAADRLRRMAASCPLGLAPQQAAALEALYCVDHLVSLLEDGYGAGYAKFVWWRAVFFRASELRIADRGMRLEEQHLSAKHDPQPAIRTPQSAIREVSP